MENLDKKGSLARTFFSERSTGSQSERSQSKAGRKEGKVGVN